MTRRNPFEEVEQFLDRMSRQVETGDWSSLTGESVAIDVVDTGDSLEVTADLPGYEREDIDITLAGDSLQIDATQVSEIEEEDVQYIRRERTDRSASRSIRLPKPVDESEASAKYANGVLHVTLPKMDPTEEGRRIDIE